MSETVAKGIRRIVAPNPSPMTYRGTNTYLVGEGSLTVVDPGPEMDAHLDAILKAAAGARIEAIVLTHSHLDHSALVPRLKDATGATVHAFGDSRAGRSARMDALAAGNLVGGGEGVDHGFIADALLADGDTIAGMQVLHTPGHMGNHICLIHGDTVLTGDHIMGWATSIVSPPDGDLTDFMESCRRLRKIPATLYLPGHGDAVQDPIARLDWLVTHRLTREAQIIDQLGNGPASAASLTAAIYHAVDPALWPAAQRNVLAHLVDLVHQNRVTPLGLLNADSTFALV